MDERSNWLGVVVALAANGVVTMKHHCLEELETDTGIVTGLMQYHVQENKYCSPDYVTLESMDLGGVVLTRENVLDLIGKAGVDMLEDTVFEGWGIDCG